MEPDTVSYSSAISACGNRAKWERTVVLLDEMRRWHVELDVISFTASVTACGKDEQWESALRLLDVM